MDQELAISNADGLGNVDNEENGSDSSGGAESERDTDVEGWALPATTHQVPDELNTACVEGKQWYKTFDTFAACNEWCVNRQCLLHGQH